MNIRRNQEGSSLTEMVVLLGILAVAAAVSIPNISGRTPHYWLEHVASTIQIELVNARTQALSQGVEVTVSIADMGDQVRVRKKADRDGSGTILRDERTDIFIDYAAPLTITLPVADAVFQPDGTFTSTDSNWRIQVRNTLLEDRFVYIFRGGHVQLANTAI